MEVIGLLMWPLAWTYPAQRSTNYYCPHLWDNYYSIGFVACALSAVFGWTALVVGILAATKPNGSERMTPQPFTARHALLPAAKWLRRQRRRSSFSPAASS